MSEGKRKILRDWKGIPGIIIGAILVLGNLRIVCAQGNGEQTTKIIESVLSNIPPVYRADIIGFLNYAGDDTHGAARELGKKIFRLEQSNAPSGTASQEKRPEVEISADKLGIDFARKINYFHQIVIDNVRADIPIEQLVTLSAAAERAKKALSREETRGLDKKLTSLGAMAAQMAERINRDSLREDAIGGASEMGRRSNQALVLSGLKNIADSTLEGRRNEKIKCGSCEKIQSYNPGGKCSRCGELLPPRPTPELPAQPTMGALHPQTQASVENLSEKTEESKAEQNRWYVENIGAWIARLREWRGMSQTQLQARSKVSRSYLSRIESGQMAPSFGTLEKICEGLEIDMARLFDPAFRKNIDIFIVLEDPLIHALRPFLRQLDWGQWQSILKRLQAISNSAPSEKY